LSNRKLNLRIPLLLGFVALTAVFLYLSTVLGISYLWLIPIGIGLCITLLLMRRNLPEAAATAPVGKDTPHLLRSRYRFVELLAESKFGKTYVAEDTQSRPKSLWVIKHFLPNSAQDANLATIKRLFIGEAKVLEKLKTLQVIPQLLQYVEDDQEVWFIREYIIGRSLAEELIPGKPLPEAQVIELLRGILQGLAAIHEFRIIHRDIKPSNIIRRKQDQQLILIDFGAAKEWDPTQVPTPMMTVAIGTAGYTAYEQMMGQPLPASDIYSAGVIGIQAITGREPNQIPLHRVTGEYDWRGSAKVSSPLAEILTKMLHTMFNERYQQAQEVLDALARL
jgi:serine/threonine protein kinase